MEGAGNQDWRAHRLNLTIPQQNPPAPVPMGEANDYAAEVPEPGAGRA